MPTRSDLLHCRCGHLLAIDPLILPGCSSEKRGFIQRRVDPAFVVGFATGGVAQRRHKPLFSACALAARLLCLHALHHFGLDLQWLEHEGGRREERSPLRRCLRLVSPLFSPPRRCLRRVPPLLSQVEFFGKMDLAWEDCFIELVDTIVESSIAYSNLIHASCTDHVPDRPPPLPPICRPRRAAARSEQTRTS